MQALHRTVILARPSTSFDHPTAISRKKVTVAFDGGRPLLDSGVTLLALAERRRAVAGTLAAVIGMASIVFCLARISHEG